MSVSQKPARKSLSRESGGEAFDVHVQTSIGTITYDRFADDSGAVAAFRLIDAHVASNRSEASFTFTLPGGGPTYNVESRFGGAS